VTREQVIRDAVGNYLNPASRVGGDGIRPAFCPPCSQRPRLCPLPAASTPPIPPQGKKLAGLLNRGPRFEDREVEPLRLMPLLSELEDRHQMDKLCVKVVELSLRSSKGMSSLTWD